MQPIDPGVSIGNTATTALDVSAAAAVQRPQVATGQPLPPSVAARVQQQTAARAKRKAAYESPEALVLARREQSLAPYRRSLERAQARLDRFGFLDRVRDPEGFERARSYLEAARSANQKAEALLDQRSGEMLEAARRTFAPPVQAPVPTSAAGPVIEIDPRHRQVQGLGR